MQIIRHKADCDIGIKLASALHVYEVSIRSAADLIECIHAPIELSVGNAIITQLDVLMCHAGSVPDVIVIKCKAATTNQNGCTIQNTGRATIHRIETCHFLTIVIAVICHQSLIVNAVGRASLDCIFTITQVIVAISETSYGCGVIQYFYPTEQVAITFVGTLSCQCCARQCPSANLVGICKVGIRPSP